MIFKWRISSGNLCNQSCTNISKPECHVTVKIFSVLKGKCTCSTLPDVNWLLIFLFLLKEQTELLENLYKPDSVPSFPCMFALWQEANDTAERYNKCKS